VGKEAWDVAFSPDGRTLAVGVEGEVIVREVAGKEKLRLPTWLPASNPVLAFRPDGRVLFGSVRSWDLSAPNEPGPAEPLAVVAQAVSRDGRRLATARHGGVIQLRDVNTLEGERLDSDGFAFLLTTGEAGPGRDERPTFEQVRRAGGSVRVRILRDGALLRE